MKSTELESIETSASNYLITEEDAQNPIVFIGSDLDDTIEGGNLNDSLAGGLGNDLIAAGTGNDLLYGGSPDGNGINANIGGRDTLEGGAGIDDYIIDLEAGGGSQIRDTQGNDAIFLIAENTDLNALDDAALESFNTDSLEPFANPTIYGNSAVSLAFPKEGSVGIQKSNTSLIIDLDRDGSIDAEKDLTVLDFFNDSGELGAGAIEVINNIVEPQAIADLFDSSVDSNDDTTIYRFFNSNSGVHFYTSNKIERDAVKKLPNFAFEEASYRGADPLTGQLEPLPVYRFLNRDTGAHLYTISEIERDAIKDLANYVDEGEAFFAYQAEVEGSIPIYRFYNSTSKAHFYTSSAVEKNSIEATLPDFQSEGIAYYAFPLSQQ